jgi:tetratricopeptide (TPR) repeat protein
VSTLQELHLRFNAWLRWLRLRRALVWAFRGLAVGLGVAVLFGLYSIVGQRVLQSEFISGMIIFSLLGLACGLLAGLFWPFGGMAAARYFDRTLGLQERVSTAFELEGGSGPAHRLFAGDQAADALAASRLVRIRTILPLQLPIREILVAVLFLAVCLGVWNFGTESFTRAAQRRQIAQAIADQAEAVEALIESIEASSELSEAQKEELTAPLEQALETLAQAGTLEEAVTALEEASQALGELSDPGAQALAQNFQDAGRELAQSDGPLDSVAENLAQGDFEQAAEDLREMDASSMEQAERERLAEQLESLADSLEGSDPALAEQLRQAAQAAREGDTAAAQEALEQAAQSFEEAGEQAAQAEAAQEAAQALEQGQQSLVQAGQQGQPGQVAEAQGAGDPSAEGENGQTGESGGGAGTGEGGSNQPAGGQQAGEGPIAQDNLPDGTGQSGFEPITPSGINAGEVERITLPSSGLQGENVIGLGPAGLGNTAPSTVPYTEVLPLYQDAAFEAIDSGAIPLQYRDLIRDYFSSLEPE